MKTWREILELSRSFLEERGVPEPETAAELLMARLLKCGRGLLAPHFPECPSQVHLDAMRRALKRLVDGEPVQYVLGEWDFRHLTLKCDRRALIPRPETEILVDRVLAHLKRRAASGAPRPIVVDVGSGSGCITLALADEFPAADYLGIDISPEAVALANENAERTGLSDRVRFVVDDGLDGFDEPQSIDVIVSNPPYVTSGECDRLDPRIRLHEPRLALDGGPEGLDFYERYTADAINLLKPGGAVFFEIGDAQGEAVEKMLFDCGFDDIAIAKDYSGRDRFASGVLK